MVLVLVSLSLSVQTGEGLQWKPLSPELSLSEPGYFGHFMLILGISFVQVEHDGFFNRF